MINFIKQLFCKHPYIQTVLETNHYFVYKPVLKNINCITGFVRESIQQTKYCPNCKKITVVTENNDSDTKLMNKTDVTLLLEKYHAANIHLIKIEETCEINLYPL